mgnify:CR=1 FL=1
MMSVLKWAYPGQDTYYTVRILLWISSFLQKCVLQTREDAGTFVGSDTRIYVREVQGHWRRGTFRDQGGGVAIATRMTTKSPDIGMEGSSLTGRILKPRLQHDKVNALSMRDRARSLVPWIVLMADMMTIPEFVTDAALRTDPSVVNLVTEWESWAMFPIRALLDEMRRCNWKMSLLLDATRMAETKSMMAQIGHRESRLRWIWRWTTFLISEVFGEAD